MTDDMPGTETPDVEWANPSSLAFLFATLVGSALLAMHPMFSDVEEPAISSVVFVSAVVLVAAAILLLTVFDHTVALPGPWVSLPLCGVVLAGALSLALASRQWPARIDILFWITTSLFFFAVHALAGTPGDKGRAARRAVVAGVLATGAVIALWGIYQKIFVMPGLLDTLRGDVRGRELLSIPGAVGRVTSGEVYAKFVTPNALAGYLTLLLPPAAGVLVWSVAAKRWAVTTFAASATVVLGLTLLFTGSPGGWVAAAAGLAVGAFALYHERLRSFVESVLPAKRPARTAALSGGIAAVVLLGAIAVWLFMQAPSMQTRAEYWKATASMVADNPLGVGLGNFSDRYPQYKTPAGGETREAHNVYLGLLAEAGPLGLIAFGLLVYGLVRTLGWQKPLSPTVPPADEWWSKLLGIMALIGGVIGIVSTQGIVLMEALVIKAYSTTGVAFAPAPYVPLVVWAVLFMVLFDADMDDARVRAGLVGGLGALLVHGLVEFDFSTRTTMLTAAALGAVVLSVGRAYRPNLRGIRVTLPALLAVGLLVPLLLFGSYRLMSLQKLASSADEGMARVEQLQTLADDLRQAGRAGDFDKVEQLLIDVDEPSLRLKIAAIRDAVSLADARKLVRAASAFDRDVRGVARSQLKDVWSHTGEYLALNPGDGERVAQYVRLTHILEISVSADPREKAASDKRMEQATHAIRLLTAHAPHSSKAWKLLGNHQAKQGHLTQAAASFQKAAEMYPLKCENWIAMGDAAVFFNPDRAEAAYEKAIAANRVVADENASLFAKLWTVRPVRPSRPDQLVKLEERPASAPFVFRTGLMYWEIGGYQEAAKRFDKALELRPGDPQFAAFKALVLKLEHLRQNTNETRDAADEAWADFRNMQNGAPAEKRLASGIVELFEHRTKAMGKAARGEAW
jgi:tetratricopeptide (TPR) repeat protein